MRWERELLNLESQHTRWKTFFTLIITKLIFTNLDNLLEMRNNLDISPLMEFIVSVVTLSMGVLCGSFIKCLNEILGGRICSANKCFLTKHEGSSNTCHQQMNKKQRGGWQGAL